MSCESCKKYREALERIYDIGCERMPAKELRRIAKQALDSIPEPVGEERISACNGCKFLSVTENTPCHKCARASPVCYSDYRDFYEPKK